MNSTRILKKSPVDKDIVGFIPDESEGIIRIPMVQFSVEDIKEGRNLVIQVYRGTYEDSDYDLNGTWLEDVEQESQEEADERVRKEEEAKKAKEEADKAYYAAQREMKDKIEYARLKKKYGNA